MASDVAREMGLTVLVMGDVIRLEAARLGLQPNDESLGMVGNMLRAQDGPQAVARKILELQISLCHYGQVEPDSSTNVPSLCTL